MEPTAQPTIMVVDDDKDLLQAMSFLLERYGFRVDARTAPPNWIELESVRPALLFLDVELQPQNGVFVCKSIKENLLTWNLPVVLTSGHAQERLEQEARLCHADAILPKPFGCGDMKRLAEYFTRGGETGVPAC